LLFLPDAERDALALDEALQDASRIHACGTSIAQAACRAVMTAESQRINRRGEPFPRNYNAGPMA